MLYDPLLPDNMMLYFLICHMVGVSSACTNPILYGFLNDNFQKVDKMSKIYLLVIFML